MARSKGIACDFCDKPLTDHPQMGETGWNYTWAETEIGSASFAYARCSDCWETDADRHSRLMACIRRAKRHGQEWGAAVDRYITETITARIESGESRLIPEPA